MHSHIVWNSTALDHTRKFRNFIGSAFALRRCSDILCAENGLSVIDKPKHSSKSQYKHYGDWLGDKKEPAQKDLLRAAIDAVLKQKPSTYEEFLVLMRAAGYEFSGKRKHITFNLPGRKPMRADTLRGDYTEAAIRERIAGLRIVSSPAGREATPYTSRGPGLLIDIEAKMREGKGKGYERFAKLYNLKQMAQTLIYLQENGLDDYSVLRDKSSAAAARFNTISDRIKELDAALASNAELQKQIITYSKTRKTYEAYRKAGYSKKFRAEHEADIILHQAAKKFFDDLGYGRDKKLPTIASLRAEYGKIDYVANAVLYYMNRGKAPEAPRPAVLDEKHIEAVINKILRERESKGAGFIPAASPPGRVDEPPLIDADVIFDEAVETLGEEGLDAIAGALDIFRRK